MPADLLLTNGRFYTMDSRRPRATAVAIRGGQIVAVGDDQAVGDTLPPGHQRINLDGRCVVPGLTDAHVHFRAYSLQLQQVDLAGLPDLAQTQARIAAFLADGAQDRRPDGWLRGRGWSQDTWPDRRFPTAADLDAVAPDIPALLSDKSGHAAWANSLALKRAGLSAATPDPPGGHIQRDAAGRPTGILFEAAIGLVAGHAPPPSIEEIAAAMRAAQAACWRAGLTGLHDFDGRNAFRALQLLHARGELGLRVVKNIPVALLEHALGMGLRTGFGDAWLRLGGVKMFADGALGPRTAALLAPYENEPDNLGIVVTDKEEMKEKASLASAHGLSVTVHAIGDRANHDVLDVYAAVRAEEAARREMAAGGVAGAAAEGSGALRHRIEHVQLLHPADSHRLAQLGIIASMQPTHATSDMEMADRYWGDRVRNSYAWRTMLDSGAVLAFGSDAPIEPIAPLPGLAAAVTRRRRDGFPGPVGWVPAQRLTVAEAVHAFTAGAAWAGNQDQYLGRVTPGKRADFTLFDQDIFDVPGEALYEATVAGTMIDGIFRYRTW